MVPPIAPGPITAIVVVILGFIADLAIKGVPYESHLLSFSKGEHKTRTLL